ncbi:hypothetical protein [Paraflavitalea pollutisoli]|uniref:hypothetical protein n=1 Tax=Paraflavitalea pollutisoli TaxID=3034143 RepID=UPI0023ECD041|nr:hypothetical protein [Paraflavitalea sp. H1-2-19X]
MAKKETKWYWIALGTVTLSVVSDNISEYTKNIPVVKQIVDLFKWLYTISERFLTMQFPLWSYLLFSICVWGIFRLLKSMFKDTNQHPSFYTYNKDKFRFWIWRWEWVWSERYNSWVITNLLSFCPVCDVGLLHVGSHKQVRCPKCQTRWPDDGAFYAEHEYEDKDDIEQLILANVRSMESKQNNG